MKPWEPNAIHSLKNPAKFKLSGFRLPLSTSKMVLGTTAQLKFHFQRCKPSKWERHTGALADSCSAGLLIASSTFQGGSHTLNQFIKELGRLQSDCRQCEHLTGIPMHFTHAPEQQQTYWNRETTQNEPEKSDLQDGYTIMVKFDIPLQHGFKARELSKDTLSSSTGWLANVKEKKLPEASLSLSQLWLNKFSLFPQATSCQSTIKNAWRQSSLFAGDFSPYQK